MGALHRFVCPPSVVPVDHKVSAKRTVDSYVTTASVTILVQLEEKIAEAEQAAGGVKDAAIATFGPNVLWDTDRNRRTIDFKDDGNGGITLECPEAVPSTLQCFYRLRRCRGWLRTPPDCLQARIQRPL